MTNFLDMGLRAASLSMMWGETLSATAFVLHRRGQVLMGAASDPAHADLQEIGRMVPEKADAFYRAFAGMGRARDPLEAMESFVRPIHKSVTGNARRLRKG